MIRVYKRKWWGLKLIFEIDATFHSIYTSTDGMIAIRKNGQYHRNSEVVFGPKEWDIAVDESSVPRNSVKVR